MISYIFCVFRLSEEYVCQCFELLWSQLKREHAEIRLSTFQIIDELFTRSHKFRELLLENFQSYLELTLGEYHIAIFLLNINVSYVYKLIQWYIFLVVFHHPNFKARLLIKLRVDARLIPAWQLFTWSESRACYLKPSLDICVTGACLGILGALCWMLVLLPRKHFIPSNS